MSGTEAIAIETKTHRKVNSTHQFVIKAMRELNGYRMRLIVRLTIGRQIAVSLTYYVDLRSF